MHSIKARIFGFILILLAFQAHSQSRYDDVQVGLMTVTPGPTYYEAFGHSAIRIKSPNYDQTFGFGYFNFADEDFMLNFIRGKMVYYLGVDDSDNEILRYKYQGRKVSMIWFNMTSSEKQSLIDELYHLAQPENRSYHYDYFANNCTSRIRDLIETHFRQQSLNELSQELKHTIYDDVFPVVNQSWLNLAFAIGFGLPAYQNKNEWELMIFPESFEQQLLNKDTQLKLVESQELWYQPTQQQTSALAYSFWKTHSAILLVSASSLLLMLLFFKHRWVHVLWVSLCSAIGMVLLFLWVFTEHKVAVWNFNLLLFFPLLFLALQQNSVGHRLLQLQMLLLSLWLTIAVFLQNLYLLGVFLVTSLTVLYLYRNQSKLN